VGVHGVRILLVAELGDAGKELVLGNQMLGGLKPQTVPLHEFSMWHVEDGLDVWTLIDRYGDLGHDSYPLFSCLEHH
jgi:hypothetical protein